MSVWPALGAPERVDAPHGMTFAALTPAAVEPDFAAVMRDIPMLRDWSGQDWPSPEFTIAENLADLERHHREQQEGVALTYSVLLDGTVQGCIYVHPGAQALATRDVTLHPPFWWGERDAVVRGWAHDLAADALIDASFALLRGPQFSFGRVWWQTNTRCTDQLVACERLGLTEVHACDGPTGTWVACAVPE
ncbi:MAG: hypothetical protein RL238_2956 [Actinomycetota bacterium]|jgi:hypothetical protein